MGAIPWELSILCYETRPPWDRSLIRRGWLASKLPSQESSWFLPSAGDDKASLHAWPGMCLLSYSLPFLLWPRQLLVFFKWICLLWMPLINGFIYLVVLDVFKVPLHCSMNQYFISSHGWITCHFMGVPDLLIRLTVDEHLSCFCFWTIMNDDTWTFVCKLLETCFHFLWSGTLLTVRGIVKHFPIKLYHFTSHQQQRVWQFHHISLNLYQCLLYYRYSNWCGVIHIYHAKNLLIQYFIVMKMSLYSCIANWNV